MGRPFPNLKINCQDLPGNVQSHLHIFPVLTRWHSKNPKRAQRPHSHISISVVPSGPLWHLFRIRGPPKSLLVAWDCWSNGVDLFSVECRYVCKASATGRAQNLCKPESPDLRRVSAGRSNRLRRWTELGRTGTA